MKPKNPNSLVSRIKNKEATKRIARHQAEIKADETDRIHVPLTHSTNMLGMSDDELGYWLDRELDVHEYETKKRNQKKRRK